MEQAIKQFKEDKINSIKIEGVKLFGNQVADLAANILEKSSGENFRNVVKETILNLFGILSNYDITNVLG